ncbi:MAG: CvpA family protein, partial [Clostridia bacterium]|nr:CvpA family protein [Clostridia bacterium]
MNFIDLLIIIFLLLGLWKGFRKGLLNSLVGLCSALVGLFVAWQTHSYVAGWLDSKFQFTTKLARYFEQRLVFSETVSQLNVGALSLPKTSGNVLSLSERLQLQLWEFAQKLGEQTGQIADFCL